MKIRIYSVLLCATCITLLSQASLVWSQDTLKSFALGSFEQVTCSPDVPDSYVSGVLISAPKHDLISEVGKRPVVPICGYYLVPVLAAMDGPPLTVHVSRIDSGMGVSGEVVEEGDNEPLVPVPPGAPQPSRESFEGVSTGSYFNLDVQRYLQEELVPGAYRVTVSYAGLCSNAVRLELKSDD